MHWIWSGDGTPQSCTSAILEIDVAFGSKNPTDVSQLAALAGSVNKLICSFKDCNAFIFSLELMSTLLPKSIDKFFKCETTSLV